MKPTILKYASLFSITLLFFLFGVSPAILAQKKYTIDYVLLDKDTSYTIQQAGLINNFQSQDSARNYMNILSLTLVNKGFAAASVDSVAHDSVSSKVYLYLGKLFTWTEINTDSIEPLALNQIGWNEIRVNKKGLDFSRLQYFQNELIDYYENTGYPFASVSMEDVHFTGNNITGRLQVVKGPLYYIDSIRVYGKMKIKNKFLQHYLGIYNGSIYNRKLLKEISKLLKELPFLQEQQKWDVTMLGGGAILNLYLMPRRSSQINVLVGFAPGNTVTGKGNITADVHFDLNNALGSGENILLNWQQLQPKSPRLNLGYSHPFIFNSKFGINLSFDLLKRDSAYLQLTSQLGINYALSPNRVIKLFYEKERSYLLGGGVDTNAVIDSKILPAQIDVASSGFGIGYHFTNTDYRLNPRNGFEGNITTTAGLKKVSKNNDIINLKDPDNPDFDFNTLYDSLKLKTFKFKGSGTFARYLPFGTNSVLKTSASAGLLLSPQLFLNELFRIGGYRLLRGFNEESIFADKYAVFTGEYRYLVGVNSFFYGFSDVGFTHTKFQSTGYSDSFISAGLGLKFETKFGLLNLSFAIGKRSDLKFDIRNSSKIHFGYINYF